MISDKDKAAAVEIARLMTEVDTDMRGAVLMEVSAALRRNGQGFTAALFQVAAVRYGFPR